MASEATTPKFLTLSENTFQDNSADEAGGAVYAFSNNALTLSDNTFPDNSAIIDGGALVVRQSTLHLTNNTLTRNTAGSNGGTILFLSNRLSTLQVHRSHRLQNNTAQYGGAVAQITSYRTKEEQLKLQAAIR